MTIDDFWKKYNHCPLCRAYVSQGAYCDGCKWESPQKGIMMNDLISRQAAIDAVRHAWAKGLEPTQFLEELPSAQPEVLKCKDCYWWTKQSDSLQGRCDRYGFYPTGYWYCAAARERREE